MNTTCIEPNVFSAKLPVGGILRCENTDGQLIRSLKTWETYPFQFPARLVVASIMNKLASIAIPAIACFLVILQVVQNHVNLNEFHQSEKAKLSGNL